MAKAVDEPASVRKLKSSQTSIAALGLDPLLVERGALARFWNASVVCLLCWMTFWRCPLCPLSFGSFGCLLCLLNVPMTGENVVGAAPGFTDFLDDAFAPEVRKPLKIRGFCIE